MRGKTLWIVIAAVVAGLVVLCGAGSVLVALSEDDGKDDDSSSAESDKSTGDEGEPASGVGEFWSTCRDKASDGQGAADVKKVQVWADDELLYVTWFLATPANPGDFGEIGTTVWATPADGGAAIGIGSKFLDGQEIGNYVTRQEADQANYDNGVIFTDGEIQARYPVGDLDDLGPRFTWWANLSLDGNDVDACGSDKKPTVAK